MTKQPPTPLLTSIAEYYTGKIEQHGQTARGVDWNGEESQILRFQQLAKIINPANRFSINDFGCGYGALLDYLSKSHTSFDYYGIDISAAMLDAARQRAASIPTSHFIQSNKPSHKTDYCVASGLFNVRLDHPADEWNAYIKSTLTTLNEYSELGFSFNCLTMYSDADKMRSNLYYADPCELFDYCKRHFARDVALLHDYGLYEFTILVRKKV